MTTHTSKVSRVGALCACTCGQVVVQKAGAGRARKWIDGHKPGQTKERLCKCGCGQQVIRLSTKGPLPKYLAGHREPPGPPKAVEPTEPVIEPDVEPTTE